MATRSRTRPTGRLRKLAGSHPALRTAAKPHQPRREQTRHAPQRIRLHPRQRRPCRPRHPRHQRPLCRARPPAPPQRQTPPYPLPPWRNRPPLPARRPLLHPRLQNQPPRQQPRRLHAGKHPRSDGRPPLLAASRALSSSAASPAANPPRGLRPRAPPRRHRIPLPARHRPRPSGKRQIRLELPAGIHRRT